jgi:mannose/cellobiose epimerase-like protein (N-acyl-D-glucosamine 2-epimerase family)
MDTFHPGFSSWLNAPAHQQWLAAEGLRLLDFAKAARLPQGFGNLDERGRLPANAQAETMNTARMTHSFAMAHIQGLPGFAELVDHGIAALRGPLRDALHGGWFAVAEHRDDNTGKNAYLHAFVALAASSAVVAQRPGAQALLDDAIDATEAFLALADVTEDPRWLVRAQRIVERVIHGHAAANDYRVIEHFDRDWQPLREYNQDNPADGFRPYGTTPGHGFEWARLLLHLEAARVQAGMLTPGWLATDAEKLFENNCHHGWNVDGAPGIVYTLDWDDKAVVRHRLHWTHAEASAAASALLKRTGEAQYETWYRLFWEFCELHFIDRCNGSWHHELNPQNQPSADIWPGKPDLYHAWQAVLIPRLPLAPSMATALAQLSCGSPV